MRSIEVLILMYYYLVFNPYNYFYTKQILKHHSSPKSVVYSRSNYGKG
ncbi:hypothetical protein CKA32_000074 [Geitlerinema sp. FC II]|nr:hypothetical protein CKA32_000074 [Geitlerinema sp. FC II]